MSTRLKPGCAIGTGIGAVLDDRRRQWHADRITAWRDLAERRLEVVGRAQTEVDALLAEFNRDWSEPPVGAWTVALLGES